MKKYLSSRLSTFLIFAIIILIFFISEKVYFRLDFTGDKRYTISNATKSILSELNETVTIKAYFSKDLPPEISKVHEDFKDLIIEYSNYSENKVEFEFINPNENEELEQKAQQEGIQPIMINVRERDQMKQQRVYMGAVVQLSEKKEVIPFVQPNSSIEYELSSAIKKLSVTDKPLIAFLQGNGEPKLSSMPQLMEQLSVSYKVDTIKLSRINSFPSNLKVLIIASPHDSINNVIKKQLEEFLNRGGRILFALNFVEGDFSTATGNDIDLGIESWFQNYNIKIDKSFLIDANCSSVMARQQQGMFVVNTPINFPYIPIISKFSEHPVSAGLEAVLMPFVSPIKIVNNNKNISALPLLFSSDKSGKEKVPVYFNISKEWTEKDFNIPSQIVAAAVESKNNSPKDFKFVLFSDGDFFVNGEGQQAQQLQPDNINLFSNAVDWLADDTGLIELRTKSVTSRPINANLDDSTKSFIKYFNFLFPIILVIFYGFFRYRKNKLTRNQLQNFNYVKEKK